MLWIWIRWIRNKLASWNRIRNFELQIGILTIYQLFKDFLEKDQYFYDFLPFVFDNIFFQCRQKYPGTIRILARNPLVSRSRILGTGLRIHNTDKIYGCNVQVPHVDASISAAHIWNFI